MLNTSSSNRSIPSHGIPLEKFRNLPLRERVADRRNVKRKRMSPIAATATRMVGGVEIAKRNAQSSERGLGGAVKGR